MFFPRKFLPINARVGDTRVLMGIVVLLSLAVVPSASADDRITIVGSSTVFPFATVVAERFSLSTGADSPVVESTGTGGGFKLFCKGIGAGTPDITNASARMKVSQLELCRKNGVDKVIEVAIGYDGIVVAQSLQGKPFALTVRLLYLALAKQIPGPDDKVGDKLIDNPYKTWRDIDPALPATKIEVLGPPPTSGTRVAFVETVMDKGALGFPSLVSLHKSDKKAFKRAAYGLREDGAYIDSGENDNLIIQKLRRNPAAIGIFGFSFLDRNRATIRGLAIDNVEPTFDKITDGRYPVARALYFYVKGAHLEKSPTLQAYVDAFLDDDTMGEDGFLLDQGLIPLSPQEIARVRTDISSRRAVQAKDLKITY